jgi:para-aminobenzoate synthetase/4-amino-4-deoxychorismate lyase
VGNGIVMDSDAKDEFAETLAKTRYLRGMDPGFTLFETMQVKCGRLRHLSLHLQRLQSSALALGFAFDEAAVQRALSAHLRVLDANRSYRLRLDLQHGGHVGVQTSPLEPLPPGPARLMLATHPVATHEAALSNHKTSLRSTYDAAIRQAIRHQAFDVIFMNQRDEVTEGARSSLFVKLNGRWWTPPLASGALAGVMRQRLLQRFPQISERVLSLEEVLSAPQIVVCSALRGLQTAQWAKDAKGEILRL